MALHNFVSPVPRTCGMASLWILTTFASIRSFVALLKLRILLLRMLLKSICKKSELFVENSGSFEQFFSDDDVRSGFLKGDNFWITA